MLLVQYHYYFCMSNMKGFVSRSQPSRVIFVYMHCAVLERCFSVTCHSVLSYN